MAPRKKKSSPVLRTPKAPQPKAAKSKVAKTTNSKKTASKKSTPLAQKVQATSIVSLENGLVSMEETPEHLVEVVKRNASNSPLLRLPGEIRNKIWALAMGGHYIHVHEVVHSKTETSYWMKTVFRAQATLKDKTCQPSAFHLPEVCRQIYSETATLGYKLNTFIFDFEGGFSAEWVDTVLPAQKNAIESVVLESVCFEPYVASAYVRSLRTKFPNLNRIEVPSDAIILVVRFNRAVDPDVLWTLKQWQEWAVDKINKKEGDDIEIVFHEKDEAEDEEGGEDMEI